MKRTSLIGLLGLTAFGQTSGPPPAFDIADLHTSGSRIGVVMTGGLLRGGRYEIHRANMVDLIRTAYGVNAENVVGGPSWLETDRFDVIAKAPASTPPDRVRLMLQTL